jgi:four helix bundle protein
MAKVSRFEELVAWQKARLLTQEVYRVSGQGEFARDFGLKDQIRRAAVSVMSNIAEGFERGKRAEFHQALSIAKGSCAEVRAQFYVALDAGFIDQKSFAKLQKDAEEVGRVIGGLRASISGRADAGW